MPGRRIALAAPAPLNCTCGRLRRLARRMTSFYEIYMRKVGLKLSQYSVLVNLSGKQQTLLHLAARLDMDRTTLTRSLKPMVDKGWVTEVAGGDARRRLLVLTEAGYAFRQRAQAQWREAQLALEARLGRDVVADLNTQLEQALSRLKPALAEDN